VGTAGQTNTRGYFTRTIAADLGAQVRLVDPATRRASPTLIVT
jgi:hypothetical protein